VIRFIGREVYDRQFEMAVV